jgi:uncharacterized protein (TIGR03790 family)
MVKCLRYLLAGCFILVGVPIVVAAEWCPVVIVVNDNSTMSQNIGERYRAKRRIPEEHVIHISCTSGEHIDRSAYDTQIKGVIESYLETHGLRDSTKYIVLTKGCPLKINGTGSTLETTGASLCGELALLYQTYPLEGRTSNPYYGADEAFDRRTYDMYLVTRLDGFEDDGDSDGVPDDIEHLIDDALRDGLPTGTYLLDIDPWFDDNGGYKMGNDWIRAARDDLLSQGGTVQYEGTWQFIGTASNLLGYCSWGSHDGQAPDDSRLLNLSFLPGSIATTYESFNAWTLNHVYMTGQWHIGDLIHDGLTGAAGYVNEPYLNWVAHPSIFLPRYNAGYPLAEAFYMSIPELSWQVTVIGDPLCPTTQTFEEPPSSVPYRLWQTY